MSLLYFTSHKIGVFLSLYYMCINMRVYALFILYLSQWDQDVVVQSNFFFFSFLAQKFIAAYYKNVSAC